MNVCAAAFPQIISTQKWKGHSLAHLTYLCTDQTEKSRWMNDVLTSTLSQHSLTKSMEHKEICFSLFTFSSRLSFILVTVAASGFHKAQARCVSVCLILMEQNYMAPSLYMFFPWWVISVPICLWSFSVFRQAIEVSSSSTVSQGNGIWNGIRCFAKKKKSIHSLGWMVQYTYHWLSLTWFKGGEHVMFFSGHSDAKFPPA